MVTRPRRRITYLIAWIVGAATLALGPLGAAEGQTPTGRDPLSFETSNPMVMGAQLRAGLELTELALVQFQRPDAFETFATGYRLASRAYGQVRVAISSMVAVRQSAKSPDPMLELLIKHTDEAWKHIRYVLDWHTSGQGSFARPDQIPTDIEHLDKAVRILRRLVTIAP